MKIGIDMVYIPRAERILHSVEELSALFDESEMVHLKDAESVAGAIALKEAFFKAVGEKKEWKTVRVCHKESGAPYLEHDTESIEAVSISHDGDYTIAVVVC